MAKQFWRAIRSILDTDEWGKEQFGDGFVVIREQHDQPALIGFVDLAPSALFDSSEYEPGKHVLVRYEFMCPDCRKPHIEHTYHVKAYLRSLLRDLCRVEF